MATVQVITPRTSPRIGIHANPSVQAYHQNLSSHIHTLLRSAGAPHAGTSLKPTPLAEAGRKTSDESVSMTGTSQRGSGTTPESGKMGESMYSSTGGVASTETGLEAVTEAEGEAEDGPPELTARPELVPRRSLLHIPDQTAHAGGQSAASSMSGEPETREQELQSAWQAEGRKVWRTMPDGFTLNLETPRRGSDVSRSAGVGLGIGLSEGMDRLQMGRAESRTTSHSGVAASSVSRSPALPTVSSFVDTAAATAASTSRVSSRPVSRQGSAPLRGVNDEKEEYEAKRLARLERKRGDLERRVQAWSKKVQAETTEEENREIFRSAISTTPPSPRGRSAAPPLQRPVHQSLPFSSGISHTFSADRRPLHVVPPTPDQEVSSIFGAPAKMARPVSLTGGVDLHAKLRALEALLGPTPTTPVGTPPPDLLCLHREKDEGTIKGRRTSRSIGMEEEVAQTPRPAAGGLLQ
ncbi:uncharacterized protein MKK02DRAFT_37732 [Dioszegia hungarica]|uniref:Uncharacterized protein n=1 Tax=Dioszegia hungarica TaxID=4972 RepID=A0AA38LRU4_9TREE|nr:uncharacterized protein MKK02DRAFT_37732 [Dioszegia hungarica]KAI9634857.1 hypothetical protein MKK02DRAFT_37732 [Dioszegia hungarica]